MSTRSARARLPQSASPGSRVVAVAAATLATPAAAAIPVARSTVAVAGTPVAAVSAVAPVLALDARPAALRRVPALADRLQRDAPPLDVDALDLDGQLVADLHGLLDARQPLAAAELRDVHQAVPHRGQVDERPEVGGLDHRALVALAHLGQARVHDLLDHVDRFLGSRALARADEHATVVLDVDVGPRHRADLVDPLALRADDLADLVHRDLDHDHAGRLGRQRGPRPRQRLRDHVQ